MAGLLLIIAALAAAVNDVPSLGMADVLAELRQLRAEVASLRKIHLNNNKFNLNTMAIPDSQGSRPAQPLDVTNFGAAGDGSDDTAAFQRALDSASTTGAGLVFVPAGKMVYILPPEVPYTFYMNPHS